MRKLLKLAAACVIAAGAVSAACFAETPELKFVPDGGGYYIYCNNNEFIRRSDLSDTSNPSPQYLMNNINMVNGRYTLYFSHMNHTELPVLETDADSADMDWSAVSEEELKKRYDVTECGFDIETDVEFKAKTDTKIRFTSIGFEVQQPLNYYYTNTLIRYENPWGCLSAVSDYMQRPIYELGGVTKYSPNSFEPIEVEIKAGEKLWLSRYIENYAAVPWLKPVHLLADFEILYGCTDINIAAMKSGKITGDRSMHSANAAHGKFYRDRQYKGVANTLPSVTAKLVYEIDDNVENGSRLPVKIVNRYTAGNETDNWITHINPYDSRTIQRYTAESDMIELEYFDPSKKKLYGENVPQKDRDSIWRFDVSHSDAKRYTVGSAPKAAEFVPNYELSVFKDNSKAGANLANYCVKTNYELTVKNSGDKTRYFNYAAKTTSGIVVSVKDEKGNYIGDFAVQKLYAAEQKEEVMACVELPPRTETRFTVEVFLPINYVGGIKNSFIISDTEAELEFPQDMKQRRVIDPNYTGRNFVKWEDGELKVSEDGELWRFVETEENVKSIFDGNSDNFTICAVGDYYAVMWDAFVPTPAYYTAYLKYKSEIFFLDKNFKLVKSLKTEGYPEEIRYAGGRYYIKAGKVYVTEDLKNLSEWKYGELNPPIECGEIMLATKRGGETYLSPDGGENFYRIAFRADVRPPRYVETLGGLFFWAEGKEIYLSHDGVEWTRIEASEKINTISAADGYFIVNSAEKIKIPAVPEYTLAAVDGEVVQYDKQVQNTSAGIKVPLEMSATQIGAEYTYDKADKTVEVRYNDTVLEMNIGSDRLTVNGKKSYMPQAVQFEHDRVFVPAETFFGVLGFECEYFEGAKTLVVRKSGDTAENTLAEEESTAESSVTENENTADGNAADEL